MIRFIPDTLWEALWRPFWMALPNAGIYVEIMAPDLRFAAIIVATALVVGSTLMGKVHGHRAGLQDATLPVLSFVVSGFVVWLYTSGNGRYFLVGLLIAGPLFAALVHRLPVSKSLRVTLVLLVMSTQIGMLVQVPPWNWWTLAPWGSQDGFYSVTLDERARVEAPTYVLLSPNSHSIIAHKFPPGASWINLNSAPVGSDVPAAQRFRKVLSEATELNLVLHTPPPELMSPMGQPSAELSGVINRMLVPHALELVDASTCRLLPSTGFASQVIKDRDQDYLNLRSKIGFWVCPLRKITPGTRAQSPEPPAEVASALAAVEKRCPRFFPPGQHGAERVSNGWMRVYPGTDLRLYVYDTGDIYYRYWRALNMGAVGTVANAINDPALLKCDHILGRSGFPGAR